MSHPISPFPARNATSRTGDNIRLVRDVLHAADGGDRPVRFDAVLPRRRDRISALHDDVPPVRPHAAGFSPRWSPSPRIRSSERGTRYI